MHPHLDSIRKYFRNKTLFVKLYSIFPWNEIFFLLKRKLFLDKQMESNNFVFKTKTNVKFHLPYYKTDLIQKEIITNNDFYEIDSLNRILKLNGKIVYTAIKNGFVLDIGSNIGNHALFFLNKCSANFAYCFEPVTDTFNILKKNIELNHLENKTLLFNVGVGESKGKAILKNYTQDNIGMSQLSLNNKGDIPIISIDNLNIKENISFAKIDVEGFELGVIKGMINTLKRCHPILMIEIRNYLFDEINKILENIGYNCIIIDSDANNIGNYLYIPTQTNS